MELLLEYGEAFLDRATQRRRWTIVLEVYQPTHVDRTAGIRWFAVVSLRPDCDQLFKLLPRRLREELRIPESRKKLEQGPLKAVFERMAKGNATVWFFPLLRNGAAVFLRKRGDDPHVKRLLCYNRPRHASGIQLKEMAVVTRTAADSSEVSGVQAALRFEITDAKAFQRSIGKRKAKE